MEAPLYLSVAWDASLPPPLDVDSFTAFLRREIPRLNALVDGPGFRLFVDPQVKTRAFGTAILVGDLIERSGVGMRDGHGPQRHDTVSEIASTISTYFWGAFVACIPDGHKWHLLRDPSGAVGAQMAQGSGFVIAASSLSREILAAVAIEPSIDREALGDAMCFSPVVTHRSLLTNITIVPAGMVARCSAHIEQPCLAWNPVALLPPADITSAETQMRGAVEKALDGWRRRAGAGLVELSGGLDSAIVLGGLSGARDTYLPHALNFATRYNGGDERRFARDAAMRSHVSLIEADADEKEMDFRFLLERPQPIEPILYGLDPVLERMVPAIAQAMSIDTIFTGQGGDAVFFHIPTPLVAADHWIAGGSARDVAATALDAARRAHCSIWRVGGHILQAALFGSAKRKLLADTSLVAPAVARSRAAHRLIHPWLRDAKRLPPAKQVQLATITNGQIFNGPTLRRAGARLVHPLLAQPVLEAALAIPCYWLASGAGNRALARRVFSEWIPPSILHRHGKGEAQIYYGRGVARNLPYLRELLLDGYLVSSHLLDREKIEATLDDELLLWQDRARLLIKYASLEAWARSWSNG